MEVCNIWIFFLWSISWEGGFFFSMDRRLIFQWGESFLGRVFKKICGVIGVPPCPIGNPISPCKKSRCQLNRIIGKWTVLEVQNQAKQAFLVIRKKNVKKKKKKKKWSVNNQSNFLEVFFCIYHYLFQCFINSTAYFKPFECPTIGRCPSKFPENIALFISKLSF